MSHKSEENSNSEVLDVLFGGIKTSPVAWTSFMEVPYLYPLFRLRERLVSGSW